MALNRLFGFPLNPQRSQRRICSFNTSRMPRSNGGGRMTPNFGPFSLDFNQEQDPTHPKPVHRAATSQCALVCRSFLGFPIFTHAPEKEKPADGGVGCGSMGSKAGVSAGSSGRAEHGARWLGPWLGRGGGGGVATDHSGGFLRWRFAKAKIPSFARETRFALLLFLNILIHAAE